MAEGRLRCIGSSLFLKKRYGVGYQLTIDRGQVGIRGGRDEPDSIKEQVAVLSERLSAIESVFDEHKDSESESDSVVGKLMSAAHGKSLKCIVTDAIHDATLLSDVGSELSYQLPLNAAPAFAPMLAELDRQIEKGAISSYGVSMTTLNEVFELVTRGEAAAENAIASSRALSSGLNNKRAPSSQSVENDPDVASSFDADTDTTNVPLNSRHFIDLEQDGLFGRHVIALLKKRGSYFRRDRKAWICTTIVPSVFVLIGFTVFAFASPNRNMKPLTLSLNDENPIFKSNTITFNSPGSPFLCQPGICSHRQPYVSDDLTNEKYAFCGYEAKLGISEKGFTPTNMTCTISESAAIIEGIATGNVLAEEAVVSNVTEVRWCSPRIDG